MINRGKHILGFARSMLYQSASRAACTTSTSFVIVAFVLASLILLSSCGQADRTYPSPLPAEFRQKLQSATAFSDVFQLVDSINLQFAKNSIITYFGSAAVSNDGKIAIGDLGNGGQVLLFDKRGKFIRIVSSSGQGPGQVESPRGLAFNEGDSLIVADSRNERLAIYDSVGNFLRDIRIYVQPIGLTTFRNSIYVVTAPLQGSPLLHFSAAGSLIGWLGRVPDAPRKLGMPISGGSISSYDDKYIYYVHPAEYDVQIFSSNDRLFREVSPSSGSLHRNLEKGPKSGSAEAIREWLKTWDPVNTVMATTKGVVLVVYQDKTVSEDKIENVVDLYDVVGNELASGLHTTYLPVCTDSEGRLYCFQKAVEQLSEDQNPMLYVLAFRSSLHAAATQTSSE